MKRLQAEVEKPKIKGRAHDKKKRMGADKDQGAEAACVDAFRLRAFKSPEEVPTDCICARVLSAAALLD